MSYLFLVHLKIIPWSDWMLLSFWNELKVWRKQCCSFASSFFYICFSVNYASKKKIVCTILTSVHRKKLEKQQPLSCPFFSVLSWSCFGREGGKCREEEEGGGVRLESHTRGTTGKGAVSYCAVTFWAVYASLSLFVFAGSQHAPVFLLSLVSIIPTGCLWMLSC